MVNEGLKYKKLHSRYQETINLLKVDSFKQR